MVFQIITGIFVGLGLFFILLDMFAVPYFKTSKAVRNLSKQQKADNSAINIFLGEVAKWLAKHIHMNEFTKVQLESDLQTAQIDMTPEMYRANAIVKAAIIAIFAIPLFFIWPIAAPIILFLAIAVFISETRKVKKIIGDKRKKIERELIRMIFTIQKRLRHDRNVMAMLEDHSHYCGPELKSELDVTVADMRSGNHEAAIERMEARIGSLQMSDVCRGLLAILHGDETEEYWRALAIKFQDIRRQELKLEAQKIPDKVHRLSMITLGLMLLMYIVVIVQVIMDNLGVIFGAM